MKIAYILPGAGYSGGVRVAVCMATELMHLGHDVRILYRKHASIEDFFIRLLHKKTGMTLKDWVFNFNGDLISFKKLKAEFLVNRDVVISIGPDCIEELMKLPPECGRKVFNVHGLTLRNSILGETAWKAPIPKIAVSNYVRQELLKAGADDVYAVIPNGVDTSEYFPDEEDSKRTAVGTVYGVGIAKNPESIMSVFAKLHEFRPEIPLLCFGRYPRPKQLIQAVTYKRLPTVEEARKLYSKCSVWFCVSRSEGFGMPVLEAMACGCAVVCTDCGGPNGFLKSGINGLIVEKEAPDKIVQEILAIIDDKSRQKQFANEGIKTAKALPWSSAALKMEAALKNITNH